jgi:Holliday junction resolvasome RuvABC endonuclease subunit
MGKNFRGKNNKNGFCVSRLRVTLKMKEFMENRSSKILALDLATSTGWAVMANGVTESGTALFRRSHGRKTISDDHAGYTFDAFDRWLAEMVATWKPEAIAYEEAGVFRNPTTARIPYGLRGIMFARAARHGVTLAGYAGSALKVYATGYGRADKKQMVAAARERWPGQDIATDDQADALWLLNLHLARTRDLSGPGLVLTRGRSKKAVTGQEKGLSAKLETK